MRVGGAYEYMYWSTYECTMYRYAICICAYCEYQFHQSVRDFAKLHRIPDWERIYRAAIVADPARSETACANLIQLLRDFGDNAGSDGPCIHARNTRMP